METITDRRETKLNLLMNLISIGVPIAVAVILAFPNKLNLGEWTKSLSHVIGAVNTLTTFFLIAGLFFIRQNKIEFHRIAMTAAFCLGGVFLICYIVYHLSNPSSRFGGKGFISYIYFFFLISHILLSLIVLPLVLRAIFFAFLKQFARHKKVVRFAYPIWLYVSISGVIIYIFMYQLFPSQ